MISSISMVLVIPCVKAERQVDEWSITGKEPKVAKPGASGNASVSFSSIRREDHRTQLEY